jgi:ornithine decarboxylase
MRRATGNASDVMYAVRFKLEHESATYDFGSKFGATPEAAVSKYFGTPPPLLCEPGRGMVAPAVSLLSRVIHVRDDQQTLFLNDGVYGGMLEQSVADLRLPVRAWREGEIFSGDTSTYRIFGPTCDPIDRLPHEVTLAKDVRAGDYIEFGLLGAYGSATSTSFNGFQSANYFNVTEGFYSR